MKGKLVKKKKIAVIRLRSDGLTKYWQGLERFRQDRGFICCTEMRSIESTNDVRFLHAGRSLAKIPIPGRFYQVSEHVGKDLPDYRLGTNWCCKCKLEADKSFMDHVLRGTWFYKQSGILKVFGSRSILSERLARKRKKLKDTMKEGFENGEKKNKNKIPSWEIGYRWRSTSLIIVYSWSGYLQHV